MCIRDRNSTIQSEEPQNVIVNRPISPMLQGWEPKIDYTQGRQLGNIIYNPHIIPTNTNQNFHVYPSNHSLPPQFPYYNNSNLYQKPQMMSPYDSNYNQAFNQHQPIVTQQTQNSFQQIIPKKKKKEKILSTKTPSEI